MEKKIADGLGAQDRRRDRRQRARPRHPGHIGNLRNVDWQSLGINFVLVFSPNAFKGAPHTHIATLTETHPDAAGDARIIKRWPTPSRW